MGTLSHFPVRPVPASAPLDLALLRFLRADGWRWMVALEAVERDELRVCVGLMIDQIVEEADGGEGLAPGLASALDLVNWIGVAAMLWVAAGEPH